MNLLVQTAALCLVSHWMMVSQTSTTQVMLSYYDQTQKTGVSFFVTVFVIR